MPASVTGVADGVVELSLGDVALGSTVVMVDSTSAMLISSFDVAAFTDMSMQLTSSTIDPLSLQLATVTFGQGNTMSTHWRLGST
jgi:hypothetical protein